MIHAGFTGTRTGMTVDQCALVHFALSTVKPIWFHHGDCVGADAEAHALAEALRVPIHIHPPTNARHRAFCANAKTHSPPLPYTARNRKIVEAAGLMIATPKEKDEQAYGSGTWNAIRYTRLKGKHLLLCWPDGTWRLERENRPLADSGSARLHFALEGVIVALSAASAA